MHYIHLYSVDLFRAEDFILAADVVYFEDKIHWSMRWRCRLNPGPDGVKPWAPLAPIGSSQFASPIWNLFMDQPSKVGDWLLLRSYYES